MVDEIEKPGEYKVVFNGSKLSSGIYFYRLEVNNINKNGKNFVSVKKMILLK